MLNFLAVLSFSCSPKILNLNKPCHLPPLLGHIGGWASLKKVMQERSLVHYNIMAITSPRTVWTAFLPGSQINMLSSCPQLYQTSPTFTPSLSAEFFVSYFKEKDKVQKIYYIYFLCLPILPTSVLTHSICSSLLLK